MTEDHWLNNARLSRWTLGKFWQTSFQSKRERRRTSFDTNSATKAKGSIWVGKKSNTNWFVDCLRLRNVSLAGGTADSSQYARRGDSGDSCCGVNNAEDWHGQHCESKTCLDECGVPDTKLMSDNHLNVQAIHLWIWSHSQPRSVYQCYIGLCKKTSKAGLTKIKIIAMWVSLWLSKS